MGQPGIRYDENLPDFVELVRELISKEQEFVVAIVVNVKGSAAAKVGAKGVILPDGTVLGWLGGWCSENAVTMAALETLTTGRPRLIKLVMAGSELRRVDEDVIEVGTPCGGEVTMYVEPVFPKPQILIFGNNRATQALSKMAKIAGFKVVVVDSSASKDDYPEADAVFNRLKDLENARIDRHTYAVIASMGRTELDLEVLEFILPRDIGKVFLVSSVNRAEDIMRRLARKGFSPTDLEKVQSPSGIDIGAATPEELALSILSGIVAYRRGGTGRFMVEVRGNPVKKVVGEIAKRKLEASRA